MNIPDRNYLIIIAVSSLLLMLASPAHATPIPVVFQGTVVDLNETGHTMTLDAACEKYFCRYKLTGQYSGLVPNDAVFSGIRKGDVVEAVFKDWIRSRTDSAIEFMNPSDGTRDVRQWYSIQRLAYADNGTTLIGTEIFGDPGYLETPLDAGYEIGYELFGPDPRMYDYRSFPVETIANTSVKKKSGFNVSRVFTTGETYLFSDPSDNTTLSMQFVGGYNGGFAPPKACPCADFHIRVISDKKRERVAMPDDMEPGVQSRTPVSPLPGIIPLAALGIIWFMKRRG